jgi:hypothetical protein
VPSTPSTTHLPTPPDGRRTRDEPVMDTTKTRAFTPGRVVALGLIAVLVLGLGYLRFAPDEGVSGSATTKSTVSRWQRRRTRRRLAGSPRDGRPAGARHVVTPRGCRCQLDPDPVRRRTGSAAWSLRRDDFRETLDPRASTGRRARHRAAKIGGRGPLLDLETDNTPRVRDGYTSLGTRGHTRARATQAEGPICRKNVIESAGRTRQYRP